MVFNFSRGTFIAGNEFLSSIPGHLRFSHEKESVNIASSKINILLAAVAINSRTLINDLQLFPCSQEFLKRVLLSDKGCGFARTFIARSRISSWRCWNCGRAVAGDPRGQFRRDATRILQRRPQNRTQDASERDAAGVTITH